jgi:hypothetical protein
MDSMIWNWYVNPVDFATNFPFFAFALSPGTAAVASSSCSFSASALAISA